VDLREDKAAAPASEALEGAVWLGVSLASTFRLIIDWMIATSVV
jgi:dsRNA-specific ribonuclease